MPKLEQISVILPVLNERDNLADLIPELHEALSTEVRNFEILVVDDSSSDGTDLLLTELSARDDRVRHILRIGKQRSLPDSISEGVEAATYEHVLWMDADGSMPAETVRKLIIEFRALDDEGSIVVGSRFVKGGGFKGVETVGETTFWQVLRNLRDSNDSFAAVFLSRALNRFLWLTLERCCRDFASGFIVVRRDIVREIGLRGSYGDYCVRFLYLAHKSGCSIIEVPYVCLVRRHGYSKTGTNLWGLIQRGLPYLALPLRIRRM